MNSINKQQIQAIPYTHKQTHNFTQKGNNNANKGHTTYDHRQGNHSNHNKQTQTRKQSNNNETYTHDKPMKQQTATQHTTNKPYTPKTNKKTRQ